MGQGLQKSEEEVRREQEQQFKKLAKLANYDNIDEFDERDKRRSGDDRKKSKSGKKDKTKEKKGKARKQESENEFSEDDVRNRPRVTDHRTREPVVLDEFDARAYADRSFDSSFESRSGRGSGRDERGSGDRRLRREGPGSVHRMDRGGIKDRSGGKIRGQKQKGLGKKGRDFIEDEVDDRDVRIERNFERLDLYEEKFERERERNLEELRRREEFQDYYRAREGPEPPRGAPYRAREVPYKGGRDLDRFEMEDRGFDRSFDEDRRRGRNRSEERVPIVRNDRRRRR